MTFTLSSRSQFSPIDRQNPNQMKNLYIILGCFCALSATILSPIEVMAKSDTNRLAEGSALAQQANDKLEQATSQKDFQEVAQLLEKIVAMDPHNFKNQRTLGWVYLDKLHDPKAAYPHLLIAVNVQPNDGD